MTPSQIRFGVVAEKQQQRTEAICALWERGWNSAQAGGEASTGSPERLAGHAAPAEKRVKADRDGLGLPTSREG